MTIEFKAWPKIPRLQNETYCITEKIDGTNACVIITEDGQIAAQSRTRIITPENDNFGFAAWVEENKEELLTLGPGYHYGEWWGRGIQRTYDLQERRFSLFMPIELGDNVTPSCVGRVPIVANTLEEALDRLSKVGSIAAPGYNRPEGLILFGKLSGVLYKYIIDKPDDRNKTKG